MYVSKRYHLTLCPTGLLIGFILTLLIPSLGVVQKYFGISGVVVYSCITASALFFLSRYVFLGIGSKVTSKQVFWLTVVTFLILLLIFWAGYPLANSDLLGKGSDRDEALNIATMELLKGNYPYYMHTYLGNPISPLPGSLVIAIPFVLLGNSAYQNIFWLFLFLITMNSLIKVRLQALLLLWIIILFSPVVLQEYITGGDFLANSIYVLLLLIWNIKVISRDVFSSWEKFLSAILLGVGFASRANFILLLPLVFSALVLNTGLNSAIKYIAVTLLTFALMTIPFYLYDPNGFTPLYTAEKINQFHTILPFAGTVIPLATGITAVILSFHPKNGCLPVLLANSTAVLALPVLSVTVLQSIMEGGPDFVFTGYGLSFLFFGAASFWLKLNRDDQSTTEHL